MVFRLSPSRTRSAQTHSATTIVCNNRTILFPPKADLFGAIHWCWILLIELTVWPILLTLKISVKSGVWATDVKSLQICDCGETGREFLLGCSRLTASAKAWFCLYASARNPLSVNFSFIYPCGQRKWTSISFVLCVNLFYKFL